MRRHRHDCGASDGDKETDDVDLSLEESLCGIRIGTVFEHLPRQTGLRRHLVVVQEKTHNRMRAAMRRADVDPQRPSQFVPVIDQQIRELCDGTPNRPTDLLTGHNMEHRT